MSQHASASACKFLLQPAAFIKHGNQKYTVPMVKISVEGVANSPV